MLTDRSLILPAPLVVKPVAPPVAEAVKVSLVKLAGNGSVMAAPVTLPGPVLLTTIVYVNDWPGMTLPVLGVMLEPPALSTLVIDRLARLSTSVAFFGVPAGGVAVAVLVMVPVAVELTVPVTIYVIVLPDGKLTDKSLMLPEPLVVKPVAPPVAEAVNVSLVKFAGNGSVTLAPVMLPGPEFPTTIV